MIEALIKIFSANYALANPAQWAIDFLNGNIRIMPLSYYRDIEDNTRRDSDECKVQTLNLRIDPTRDVQYFYNFNGWKSLKTTDLLRDYPTAIGQIIPYTEEIDPTILCMSMAPFDLKEAEKAIFKILLGRPEVNYPKGRYLMACSGVHLCSSLDNEIKFNNDFESMVRSRVIYVPSKEEIKSPFCKLQKFSFENEYRFIFPKINHSYVFHLKPIPGIIFDLEDNCKVIYNNLGKDK